MGWVRLDDELFLNRKINAAGKDATLLYIACLTISSRHGTDGKLTDAQVRLAAGAADVKPIVMAKLVDAGLVDRVGDEYLIPDYLDYNPSSAAELERRAKERERKRAARARGAAKVENGPDGKFRPRGRPAGQDADNGPGDGTVPPDGAPDSTAPSAATPSSFEQVSSSTNVGGESVQTDDERFGAVCRLLADADLERRLRDKPDVPVGDDCRWIETAIRRRANLDGERIRAALSANPTWSPAEVVGSLEGPPPQTPGDELVAAQAARMERNRQRLEGKACPLCEGVGVVEHEDGTYDDCECKTSVSV